MEGLAPKDHQKNDPQVDDGPPEISSDTEQIRISTDYGEAIDPEISTNNRQVDSMSTQAQAQTDANTSSPHASNTCSNTKAPLDSRPTDHMPDHAVVRLIERADKSAGRLVNLLATHFPLCFRDEARFDGRRVKLFKRAQIFVADLWAALNAKGLGEFGDIDHLTMFPGKSMRTQQTTAYVGGISVADQSSLCICA